MKDSSKKISSPRLQLSCQERGELLSLYDSSGLTQAAFSREYGINYQTFCGWLKRRRSAQASDASKSESAFAEVSLSSLKIESAGPWQWELSLPEGTVVRSNSAVPEVAALLSSLKAGASC